VDLGSVALVSPCSAAQAEMTTGNLATMVVDLDLMLTCPELPQELPSQGLQGLGSQLE